MILLFEEQSYSRDTLLDVLGSNHSDFFAKESGKSTVTPNCVGYYFSSQFRQPVFILPKVFNYLNDKGEQRAFGFIKQDGDKALDSNELKKKWKNVDSSESSWDYDLLMKMPSYLYRAIDRYRKSLKKGDSKAVKNERTFDIESSRRGENETSLIDQCHTLIHFYENNQSLITLVYKQVHSGFNKVNWAKTVRTVQPLISGDQVFYPVVFNHRKSINYDEELIVLLFCTLRYMNEEYGYGNAINTFYNLPERSVFSRQVKQRSVSKYLKKIKNNYSNDVMRKLWHLLYAFHSELDSFNGAVSDKEEYLFVKKFNNVFEKMIDELLGDSDFPKELKDQKDGKIIDHLFKHASLPIENKEVYYVGDSKYYKDGAEPEGTSRFKQFTYVKNIVQTQMNWSQSEDERYLDYRDELTEGYSITPNFFIMGLVRPEYRWTDHHLLSVPFKDGERLDKMYQFTNRLFDRDTLFLMQYSVNFMFVLKAYTSYSTHKKFEFKSVAKKKFRNNFLREINGRYSFNLLFPKGDNSTKEQILANREEAVSKSFRKLIGKIYCPTFLDTDNNPLPWLIMALENNATDNATSLAEADKNFEILQGYKLGEDPFKFIERHQSQQPQIEEQPVTEFEQTSPDEVRVEMPKTTELRQEVVGMHAEQTEVSLAAKCVPPVTANNEEDEESDEDQEIEILDSRDITEDMKFDPFIPFFTIKGACGGFMDNYVETADGDLGWIDASSFTGRLNKNYFVIQASGNSMLPTIEDGDYCVFEWYSPSAAGSRNYQIVLAKNTEDWDGDYLGHFTIKQYRHLPNGSRVLKPLNTDGYVDIPITEESEITILAIYKGKLKI